MKIHSVHIYRFRIPFKKEIQLFTQSFSFREGILLKLTDSEGYFGIGEISPLPEFHSESLEKSISLLRNIARTITSMKWEEQDFQKIFTIPLFEYKVPSILQFSIESALLLWYCKKKNTELSQLFYESPASSVSLNALLTGDETSILQQLEAKKQEGYSVFKLKVGRKDISNELQLIQKIYQIHGSEIQLRLDANRNWQTDEAIRFCKNLPFDFIEYVEEPLQNIEDYPKLFQQTRCPIALDESLSVIAEQKLFHIPGLKAIIIKPDLLGSYTHIIHLLHQARLHGIYPVFSNSLYSPFGILSIAHMAAAMADHTIAQGLHTFQLFEKTREFPPLTLDKDSLITTSLLDYIQKMDIQNWELLYETGS